MDISRAAWAGALSEAAFVNGHDDCATSPPEELWELFEHDIQYTPSVRPGLTSAAHIGYLLMLALAHVLWGEPEQY